MYPRVSEMGTHLNVFPNLLANICLFFFLDAALLQDVTQPTSAPIAHFTNMFKKSIP